MPTRFFLCLGFSAFFGSAHASPPYPNNPNHPSTRSKQNHPSIRDNPNHPSTRDNPNHPSIRSKQNHPSVRDHRRLYADARLPDGTIQSGKLIIEDAPLPRSAFPTQNADCWPYVRRHQLRPSRPHRHYPKTVEQAVQWLLAAKKRGRLFFQQGAILGHLQSVIDQHTQGDLYLFFGNNHTITTHYRFFNEALHLGKDGLQLTGITHLALEAFVTDFHSPPLSRQTTRWLRDIWGKNQRDLLRDPSRRQHLARLLLTSQQPLIDLYLHRKQDWAFRLLTVVNRFLLGRAYSRSFLNEIEATLRHARNHPNGPLDVIATDMSLSLRQRFYHVYCWIYPLREAFGLQIIQRRLQQKPQKRRVIALMWGADHIRKQRFPRFLPTTTPTYSVRLAGGSKPDLWDLAFARLGWPLRAFALDTPNAEEADLLIHFPPKGSFALASTEIRKIALARLLRQTQGSRWNDLSPVSLTYQNNLRQVLQFLQPRLDRCHQHGFSPLQIELHIGSSGRIVRTIIRSNPFRSWSERCIRLALWRYPLPPPPRGAPLRLDFVLQRTKLR
ncbi:hypothetical protein L6R29_08595 [Myxococcota bacterium]|nr:hypothetical protein [Myxococcota bacterium]